MKKFFIIIFIFTILVLTISKNHNQSFAAFPLAPITSTDTTPTSVPTATPCKKALEDCSNNLDCCKDLVCENGKCYENEEVPVCGNGIVEQPYEECEPPGSVIGSLGCDFCSATCRCVAITHLKNQERFLKFF